MIVFVHGGSNITGYTADPVYDGATLSKTANAVVVTVNYRLGVPTVDEYLGSGSTSASTAKTSGAPKSMRDLTFDMSGGTKGAKRL